ncbi:LysR family transcriptional regulator [Novosphingobium sp. 9]|uniref:LysR family transcriptional regulator n=1 Tax=Novosphingobium sp. 9 TaxID=2025349 RepID=UPI0028CB41AC|nr:LysR family transcriptional regulator [Novosphingobium sp. 9]
MSMPDLDWSDCQAFLAVARSGQLAAAGRRLGVDPTTVSRRLRRLEAAVGQTLFEQSRTGQELTEAGEAMLTSVEAMALAAHEISERAEDEEGLGGTLRMSVTEGFGSWFLASMLPRFREAHPRLAIDLVASSGFLSPSRREADVAIMLSRPRAGPLVAHKLTDYTLRLYASTDYLVTRDLPKVPADLEQHQLVGYIPDLIYAPELRYLEEIHPNLKPTIRSTSIAAQQNLLAAGAGIAVLPCFMADRDTRLERVMPDVSISRSLWFVTHQDTRSFRRVRLLREWLDEIVDIMEVSLRPK